MREAYGAGQLPAETDVIALGDVVPSLIGGYMLQRRNVGAIDPGLYADATGALLHA
ncbi:MAG: hypothetical protein WAV54_13705 [Acidimicrobiales bacterium]